MRTFTLVHSMQTLMITSFKELPRHTLLVNLDLFIANCAHQYFSNKSGSVNFQHFRFPTSCKKREDYKENHKSSSNCQTEQLIQGMTHFHRTNTNANIYLLKSNNRSTEAGLVFLLFLTWNIFHTSLQCFQYC